jgi:AcrR family transcriptional regulator
MSAEIQVRPAPRWRRRKDARPAEILAAATQVFGERGYDATRLDDVARLAGCTKGTIFLYYRNKAELFRASVREAVLPLVEENERTAAAHTGGARELLEKLLRMRWEHVMRNRFSAMIKLMLAETHAHPELARFCHDEFIERNQAVLRGVLQRGVDRGEFRRMDVQQAARFVVAPILFAVVWRHALAHALDSQFSFEDFFETSLQVMLQGLSAEPAHTLSPA